MSDQDYNNAVSTLGNLYQREVKDVAEAIFSEEVQPAVDALDVATDEQDTALHFVPELEQHLAQLEVDYSDALGVYAHVNYSPEDSKDLNDAEFESERLALEIEDTQGELDAINALDEVKDEAENELEIAINNAIDAVHEYVDGHEYIIYDHYHAFILLCSNGQPNADFIDDECLKEDLTSLAFAHFYADVTQALNYIIGRC